VAVDDSDIAGTDGQQVRTVFVRAIDKSLGWTPFSCKLVKARALMAVYTDYLHCGR